MLWLGSPGTVNLSRLSRRILYVDANADNRQVLAHLLARQGYEVSTAGSSSDALKMAEEGSFSVYVTDAWLGGDTGVDLCNRLHSTDPQATVIFFSGAIADSLVSAAFEAGARAFVSKPDLDRLLLLIADLLPMPQPANRPPLSASDLSVASVC